ncbi:MAG: hypothetical protein EOP04_23330 [Proteobacteria bacterium]|nr:MAG: hypothetical protein EOP04_23330 [Pseudomonadota bacterium]
MPNKIDLLNREVALETQSRFDEGIAFPAMDNTFTAFDEGWEITDKLADILKLTAEERTKAQETIDSFVSTFETLVAQNSAPAPDLSGPEGKTISYRVRPFRTSGHAALEALHHKLRLVVKPEKGEELFKYIRWRPHLGAFGANEVEISFPPPGDSKDSAKVWFTRRNSMTGKTISSYECTEEQLLKDQGFKRSMFPD